MKTTKLKEWLIKASRSETSKSKLKIAIIISLIVVLTIAFTLGIIMAIYDSDLPFVWYFLSILMCWTPTSMMVFLLILEAIKERKEDVVRNNKLINVIMSDISVVNAVINTYLFGPLLHVINALLLNRIVMAWITVLLMIIMILCSAILSRIISTHFEKKLSK